jgi:hypothetical protein
MAGFSMSNTMYISIYIVKNTSAYVVHNLVMYTYT